MARGPHVVRAVVFDMDGVIVDSEPLWHAVEQDVFARLGTPITLAQCLETTGLRVDEVVLHRWERQPWTGGQSREEVARMIIEGMESRLRAGATAMPGLREALVFLQSLRLPLAVASSSPLELIHACLEGLGIASYFTHVCSATAEPLGKPHPAVYLTAARLLGVAARDCVAIEDSFNGALAAKAARMRCLAVPDLRLVRDLGELSRFAFCDGVLPSLHALDEQLWAKLNL
jgi:HAD superfamily hydrolase (TIGR01509 family)